MKFPTLTAISLAAALAAVPAIAQTQNTIRLPNTPATFDKLAQPTPLQARALELAQHAPVLT